MLIRDEGYTLNDVPGVDQIVIRPAVPDDGVVFDLQDLDSSQLTTVDDVEAFRDALTQALELADRVTRQNY